MLGAATLLANNSYMISQALEHNPEPVFISQMVLFSALSIKTIMFELKNLKQEKSNKENINKIPNNFSNFLKNKTNAVKKGLKRFGVNTLNGIKENKNILAASFLLLSSYAMQKYNIDMETLNNGLNLLASKGTEIFATTTAILGVNEISKGKLFNAGNLFLASNMAWIANPNSDLFLALSTVLQLQQKMVYLY